MTQLEDLSDDCLIEVLEWLAPEQLFKMQRLNKRMKRLAAVKMLVKIKAIRIESYKNEVCHDCAHLPPVSQDQVLVLDSLGEKFALHSCFCLRKPSDDPIFLSPISNCAGVKSIDLSDCPADLLLKMIQLCPEVECIKIQPFSENNETDKWEQVLDRIGHQLVHFVKICHPSHSQSYEVRLLSMVAAKCPNLQRLDWCVNWGLTGDLVATFKMLPKSCWIKLKSEVFSEDLIGNVYEDVFDELDLEKLDWSWFGLRLERLSILTYKYTLVSDEDAFHGVDFVNLKKLKLTFRLAYNEDSIVCPVMSSFPLLEEFSFEPDDELDENMYNLLLQKMTSLKKLGFIVSFFRFSLLQNSEVPCLPGSAIHHLKKLDTICLKICYGANECKSETFVFLEQLEQYVDEIRLLKKLIIKIKSCKRGSEWLKKIQDEVERIKTKQNHVEVDLIVKDYY